MPANDGRTLTDDTSISIPLRLREKERKSKSSYLSPKKVKADINVASEQAIRIVRVSLTVTYLNKFDAPVRPYTLYVYHVMTFFLLSGPPRRILSTRVPISLVWSSASHQYWASKKKDSWAPFLTAVGQTIEDFTRLFQQATYLRDDGGAESPFLLYPTSQHSSLTTCTFDKLTTISG